MYFWNKLTKLNYYSHKINRLEKMFLLHNETFKISRFDRLLVAFECKSKSTKEHEISIKAKQCLFDGNQSKEAAQ